MRDHTALGNAAYDELAASRRTVVDLVTRFEQRGIRATWATVGMLFASTKAELEGHLPSSRPAYRRAELDPYAESVGVDELADPEHLAGSLVRLLASTEGQEVGSHTFSHYYCLEEGQAESDLRADLAAAQSIAGSHGLTLTSLVLPRNQWNPRYASAVIDSGFTCFRGPQPSRGHRARADDEQRPIDRVTRLVDTYAGVTPPPTFAWDGLRRPDGLHDIPASAFLRPYAPGRRHLEPLRTRRLASGLRDAARRGRVFHLWWHPHNFTRYPSESFACLDRVLDGYDDLARTEGMRSMSMRDAVAFLGDGGSSD